MAIRRVSLVLLSLFVGWGCGASPSTTADAPRQAGRHPNLPTADEIAEVRLIPNHNYPPEKLPAITVKSPEGIRAVLDWINAIDWSKEPGDITRMDLPPMSELLIVKKNGETTNFFWVERGMIVGKWIWTADTDHLLAILNRYKS